jgi:CubicO group peptidase (beta-lactamase class C family)
LPKAKYSRLVAVYTPDKQQHLVKWSLSTFQGVSADYPMVNGTYYSGGAGLSSTIKDYAIFLQMLLNNGEYNGHRLLARHTVELMTSNQIGDLTVSGSADKFGLGFAVTTKVGQAKLGQTEGSFSWGGAFGTVYWDDPKEHLVCLFFVQELPYPHGELNDKFKVLVYSALND